MAQVTGTTTRSYIFDFKNNLHTSGGDMGRFESQWSPIARSGAVHLDKACSTTNPPNCPSSSRAAPTAVLLASFVGPIDDPVRRDIRKLGAGRETGFVYHRAKAALMPLAVLPWGHLPCRRCHCIPC